MHKMCELLRCESGIGGKGQGKHGARLLREEGEADTAELEGGIKKLAQTVGKSVGRKEKVSVSRGERFDRKQTAEALFKVGGQLCNKMTLRIYALTEAYVILKDKIGGKRSATLRLSSPIKEKRSTTVDIFALFLREFCFTWMVSPILFSI